jgi:hypothetical protein
MNIVTPSSDGGKPRAADSRQATLPDDPPCGDVPEPRDRGDRAAAPDRTGPASPDLLNLRDLSPLDPIDGGESCVVVLFCPLDGEILHGPFPSREVAVRWAMLHIDDWRPGEWFTCRMQCPEPIALARAMEVHPRTGPAFRAAGQLAQVIATLGGPEAEVIATLGATGYRLGPPGRALKAPGGPVAPPEGRESSGDTGPPAGRPTADPGAVEDHRPMLDPRQLKTFRDYEATVREIERLDRDRVEAATRRDGLARAINGILDAEGGIVVVDGTAYLPRSDDDAVWFDREPVKIVHVSR